MNEDANQLCDCGCTHGVTPEEAARRNTVQVPPEDDPVWGVEASAKDMRDFHEYRYAHDSEYRAKWDVWAKQKGSV